MKCTATQRQIYKQLDGELNTAAAARFAAHVESCPDCRREWHDAQTLASSLRGRIVPEPASPEFIARTMARIRAEDNWREAPVYRFTISRRLVHSGAAVVCALAISVVVLWQRRSVNPPRTPAPVVARAVPITPATPVIHSLPKPISPQRVSAASRPARKRPAAPRLVQHPIVARVTAGAAGLQFCSTSGPLWRNRAATGIRKGELLRTSGQIAQVTTYQGHRVWLNAGTVVQFRSGSLALFRGEVFVIAHHSETGFIVRTPGTRTIVHGTRFNVKLVGHTTEVTVVTGLVTVGTAKGTCRLSDEQQTIAAPDGSPAMPTTVDSHAVAAWTGLTHPRHPASAAPPREPAVTFTAAVSAAAVGAPVAFTVDVDYAAPAPRKVSLSVSIVDAGGKVVASFSEPMADRQYRYRVKRIAATALPAGSYTARFALTADGGVRTQDVPFVVK